MYSRKNLGRRIEPISIYVSIYTFMSNKEYAASAGETHELFSQLVAIFVLIMVAVFQILPLWQRFYSKSKILNPVLNICLSRYKQRVISRWKEADRRTDRDTNQ